MNIVYATIKHVPVDLGITNMTLTFSPNPPIRSEQAKIYFL